MKTAPNMGPDSSDGIAREADPSRATRRLPPAAAVCA